MALLLLNKYIKLLDYIAALSRRRTNDHSSSLRGLIFKPSAIVDFEGPQNKIMKNDDDDDDDNAVVIIISISDDE